MGLALSVVVVGAAYLMLRFAEGTATRLSVRFNRRRLFIQQVESITRFSVYMFAGILVLGLSFEITPEEAGLARSPLAALKASSCACSIKRGRPS